MTYYAITGRINGDDEDTLHIYGPCAKSEAVAAFKEDLIEESHCSRETLQEIAKDIHGDSSKFPGYINSVVQSDSPIKDCA